MTRLGLYRAPGLLSCLGGGDADSARRRLRRNALPPICYREPPYASYRFSVFAHRRRHRAEAERRQVAVVFTYMVGFTAFSERSGEEAAYTLLQSLAKLMEDAVRDNGGVVRGFTGDGVMVVFGAPVAFEDAPLRACRAALAILERRATLKYQSLLRFDDD